ncbi:MAG: hypothetical protein US03_C0007G0056 [candidate division TM6 bacterium GW2011_GWF2_36_131]|nr:MAG: hypothetical protein US03_C0007G0056 [candidate division TM6 bacterium GW2011_GWF2_36_131]
MYGAIAQLVERMNGIHEVTGSNPVSSTSLGLSGSSASANFDWQASFRFEPIILSDLREFI